MTNLTKLNQLINKGVKILNPESVFISSEINVDRISGENVTIFPGTRLLGEQTLICSGVELGQEMPVTIDNCFVGPGSSLKGGFFQGACFVGKNSFGSSAHVRPGTILEEEASAAHCVGLKQTILFPFVTLGSLINFCDCFMAGGTDRKNHSEVGSSYIHFNYTPNQDKATPSMMGDVHQGVLLNQNPIFLGGQGGLVGPCKLAFGCLTVAGSIIRKDELKNDRMLLGGALKDISIKRGDKVYSNFSKIYNRNIEYISALISLLNWYREIRAFFVSDFFSKEMHLGMMYTLEVAIDERIKRLEEFLIKSPGSHINSENDLVENFTSNISFLRSQKNADFSESMPELKIPSNDYISYIKSLDSSPGIKISRWLFSIEYKICEKIKI